MLITFSLSILSVLTIFSMLLNNGQITDLGVGFQGFTMSMDAQTGIITLIIVILVAGVASGLNVFGSGLNEQAVRNLTLGIAYGGLWALLSVLSYKFFEAVQVFGLVIWLSLTIMYVVGVFNKVAQ